MLGDTVKDRLNIMIHDIINNSMDRPSIFMSPDVERAMRGLESGCSSMSTAILPPRARRKSPAADRDTLRILPEACGRAAGRIPGR
ncbi:MAG: hypothetical protein ACLUAR_18895 [Pilosibacter sp.]